MAEQSHEKKRLKTNDDLREENSSDDGDTETQEFRSVFPPEVEEMIICWLPYEKIAQFALVFEEWEPKYLKLVERGLQWVIRAQQKWLARRRIRLSGLENAFILRVQSAWQDLLFAFRYVEVWCYNPCPERESSRDDFEIMGRRLDEAKRCHRHMRDMIPVIQARLKDLDQDCRAEFYLKSALQ